MYICCTSNNVTKRLRAHSGLSKGGAKYTKSKGPYVKHICIIHEFPKINAVRFESVLKRIPPRNSCDRVNRIKIIYFTK